MAPAGPDATELVHSGQPDIPLHFHANPSRLLLTGNQFKGRDDGGGNRLRSTRRRIDKDPFGFARSDNHLVNLPHKLVFSE